MKDVPGLEFQWFSNKLGVPLNSPNGTITLSSLKVICLVSNRGMRVYLLLPVYTPKVLLWLLLYIISETIDLLVV